MKLLILSILFISNSFANFGVNIEPSRGIEGHTRGIILSSTQVMLNMHLNEKTSIGLNYTRSKEEQFSFTSFHPKHETNLVSVYGRYDSKKSKYFDISWQLGLGYVFGETRGKFIKKEYDDTPSSWLSFSKDRMYYSKKVISSPALTQALRFNLHIGYIGLTITETMTFYLNDIQGGLALGFPVGFQ
jgi:hypothetical protein